MLKHSGTGVCLAMDFRNDSFIVEATIRQVAAVGDVRALKVDVPELWSQAQTGWNGVALTVDSSIASLRAGCKHVGISQSGSKSKLFRRLVSHFEQKQLEVIYATHPMVPVVQPKPQMLATAPGDFSTISMHELTHLPYEPWCPVCVANEGRPESHSSNPAKQAERSISVVSFDLSYTQAKRLLMEALLNWLKPKQIGTRS